MLAGLGDALPVSAPAAGRHRPWATRWEKRNIAEEIPIWKEALCTPVQPLRRRLPRTRRSAPKWSPRKRWRTPLPACIRWM
ncbi:hypothetical protein LNO88_12225 [Klebsiella pneumoniae subsp. pneumoniae]|nr:hypothetical protein [Klebsiella pneumoniae subsp. pneumoniae]